MINADSISDGANGIVATAVNSLMIDNSSDISVSGYGNVFGLDVVDAYTASLNNSADISAEAGVGAGYFGTGAYATAARVNSMDAIVCNYGGISATATADGYYARARAVDSFGYSVGSTVYNAAGDIQASAQADGGRGACNRRLFLRLRRLVERRQRRRHPRQCPGGRRSGVCHAPSTR